MSRDDVKKMILYFAAAYPGAYDTQDIGVTIGLYLDSFRDEATAVMNEAAKNYIRQNKFPPTVAGLQEQVDLIKETETGADMWKYISRAARNGTYGAKEEFEKLPTECQRFLGTASALKDMASAESGIVETVVKGQFLKNIEKIKRHEEVQAGLPMEVRQALADSKAKMLAEQIGD